MQKTLSLKVILVVSIFKNDLILFDLIFWKLLWTYIHVSGRHFIEFISKIKRSINTDFSKERRRKGVLKMAE